jgi:hypothetical protein
MKAIAGNKNNQILRAGESKSAMAASPFFIFKEVK